MLGHDTIKSGTWVQNTLSARPLSNNAADWSTYSSGGVDPVAKLLVNDLSFLYRTDPSRSLSNSTVSIPDLRLSGEGLDDCFFVELEEATAVDVGGGGNCNMLSSGGGFFGANAVTTLGFFEVEVGGGGKSIELESDGIGEEDGADPGALPALSFRARA